MDVSSTTLKTRPSRNAWILKIPTNRPFAVEPVTKERATNAPPEEVVFALKFHRKGMTFTELIVSLGIVALLMGISSVSFLYYYNVTGKLAALQQIGADVLQKMQICTERTILETGGENLLPKDLNGDGDTTDPGEGGCDSKQKLNLNNCDECAEPLTQNTRICMTITKGKLSQCVSYRPSATYANRYKASLNYKVCSQARSATAWHPIWPYITCETDSDCESPLVCKKQTGKCITSGTNINCF